jgi:hypothetical protein
MVKSVNVGMTPGRVEIPESDLENLEEWVVIFLVPEEASGFGLHMSNLRPHAKQPEAASVRLER